MFEDLKPQQNKSGIMNNEFPPEGDQPLAEGIKNGEGSGMRQEEQKIEKLANAGKSQKQISSFPSIRGDRGVSAKEPEDIFSGAEDKNKPFLKEVNPEDKRKKEEATEQEVLNSNKKRIIFISISVSAIVLIVAFFMVWNKWGGENTSEIGQPLAETQKPVESAGESGSVNQESEIMNNESGILPAQPENIQPEILDTDGDGLTDEEEAKLGTSPNNVDTDGDGLSDREEINVYKTDPLNPDSDSDSYLDGAEVKSGYNPKGAGKLYGN